MEFCRDMRIDCAHSRSEGPRRHPWMVTYASELRVFVQSTRPPDLLPLEVSYDVQPWYETSCTRKAIVGMHVVAQPRPGFVVVVFRRQSAAEEGRSGSKPSVGSRHNPIGVDKYDFLLFS